MTTAPTGKKPAIVLFVAVAAGITALDLWSKDAVFKLLEVSIIEKSPAGWRLEQKTYPIIDGWFTLEATYNLGAFSGWLPRPRVLAALSIAAAFILTAIAGHHIRERPRPDLSFILALGLLLGGTLGNLYDRALIGAVRDWVRWYFVWNGREYVWPNFNVADSAICTGVGLLLLLEIRRWRREAKTAAQPGGEGAAER